MVLRYIKAEKCEITFSEGIGEWEILFIKNLLYASYWTWTTSCFKSPNLHSLPLSLRQIHFINLTWMRKLDCRKRFQTFCNIMYILRIWRKDSTSDIHWKGRTDLLHSPNWIIAFIYRRQKHEELIAGSFSLASHL